MSGRCVVGAVGLALLLDSLATIAQRRVLSIEGLGLGNGRDGHSHARDSNGELRILEALDDGTNSVNSSHGKQEAFRPAVRPA